MSEARRKLLSRLRRRKARDREGLFLVEGARAVSEALEARVPMAFAVVSPGFQESERGPRLAASLAEATEVCEVSDRELARLSATESPQGVLLVCREPSMGLDDLGGSPGRPRAREGLRLLIVDGIQDPGNLGTLVRASAAFALSGVVVLEGSVDPYNPKAVRGSAGTLFRMPVVRAPWQRVHPWLEERKVRLFLGDAAGVDVAEVEIAPPWALVVGSEGAGARQAVRLAAEERLAILMPGGTESLNAGVAGALLLYSLTRENARG